jgi:hypothetical protein
MRVVNSSPSPLFKAQKKILELGCMEEHVLSTHDTLGSIPSTKNKTKEANFCLAWNESA